MLPPPLNYGGGGGRGAGGGVFLVLKQFLRGVGFFFKRDDTCIFLYYSIHLLFREEISPCAAAHMGYVMGVCDRV